jgi:DNA-binding transcriptional LysR family regulator
MAAIMGAVLCVGSELSLRTVRTATLNHKRAFVYDREPMDLNRLRYFSVVAETGSIRHAATLLHLTPTALSKAVKVLEREVGVELVRPQGRGIALTDEGRILARRAVPVIAELASLPALLTTRREAGPALRYASHEVFGTYFTRPLLDAMPEGGTIEHRYLPPGDIEAAVLSGDSDLGITYIPMPTTGLEHRKVAEVEMGTYGLQRLVDVPFAELGFAAPVRPTIGSAVRAQSLDAWPDDRIPRTIRHRITTTEAALELCRQGRAVARFPDFVIELHNRTTAPKQRLVRIPDPPELDPTPQEVFVVTRVGEPREEQAGWVQTALDAAAG